MTKNPHDALRHHVTGAIARGEAEPISALEAEPDVNNIDPAHATAYRVTWEIDVEAHDPVHAAQRAYDSFMRPGSIAHVFKVTETIANVPDDIDGATVTYEIDLDRGRDSNRDGEPISYPLTEEG